MSGAAEFLDDRYSELLTEQGGETWRDDFNRPEVLEPFWKAYKQVMQDKRDREPDVGNSFFGCHC